MTMAMEYVFIIFSIILALVGFAGAIVPGIPGPPLSYLGLVLIALCDNDKLGVTSLVVAGILALVVTVLDFVAPAWFAKRSGGSKAGIWGATIGLIFGLFGGFVGIILGSFLGALIGEMLVKTPGKKALHVAFMSFVAFIATSGMKMIYSAVLFAMIVKEIWQMLFG